MTIIDRPGERPGAADAEVGRQPGAARNRAALETYLRHESALRRTARRYSICSADAEDALQRGLEILLRKAPSEDPRELIRWTQTVVKHEALAVRRDRERILAGPAATTPEPGAEDWVALLPATSDGPAERAERHEAVARSREALQTLKPQELRALTLLAEGYSYAEIGEITGYSRTKINRCLAEGRERFRRLISRSEDGRLCAEMGPLLSAFCDGEAAGEETARLREHLRACAGCRATLRAYRAAPAAAAALAPALPMHRSLLERGHDVLGTLFARLGAGGGTGGEALPQVAASGGARGIGVAAIAKVAAICIGTAGGAAACVATGIVPAPLGLASEPVPRPRLERQELEAEAPDRYRGVTYESAPAPEAASPPRPHHEPAAPVHAQPAPEPEPTAPPEPGSGGAVEYVHPAPAPEPAPAPAPEAAPAAEGNPGGEFGP